MNSQNCTRTLTFPEILPSAAMHGRLAVCVELSDPAMTSFFISRPTPKKKKHMSPSLILPQTQKIQCPSTYITYYIKPLQRLLLRIFTSSARTARAHQCSAAGESPTARPMLPACRANWRARAKTLCTAPAVLSSGPGRSTNSRPELAVPAGGRLLGFRVQGLESRA